MPVLYGAVARIALDIDSTLHHYWDLLERIARERYGVELPYAEQRDWGITVLERDAIVHCVEESHSNENIAAGVPYPDAVETVREWHGAGHWIHVLVDDSPANIAKARAAGMVAATIIHPWNEEIVDTDGVIGAADWRSLKAALDPVLDRLDA